MEMLDAKRMQYLQGEIAKAKQEMAGLSERTNQAREAADALAPTWLSLGQAGKAVWGVQVAELDELRKRYGETSEVVRRLEAEMARATPGTVAHTAAAGNEVTKLTAKLTEQIAATFATADATERYKLAQAGANDAQIASVAILQKKAAAAAAEKSLQDDSLALIKSLHQQAAEFGKTEAEVQRMRLAARGLDADWLATIATLQTRIAANENLAEANKQVGEITKSLKEQIATAGMTAEQTERYKLAQAGATAEQLAGVAALQQQALLVKEAVDAKKKADEVKSQQQKDIADRIRAVKDETALLFLQKDAKAQIALAAKGITAEQQMELNRLRAQGSAVGELETAFKRANEAKRKLQATSTDTTTTSKTMAEAYDIMRAAREVIPVAMTGPDILRPIPESAKSGTQQVSGDQADQQIALMNRQLAILERIAESNGVTIQEVRV
jgi:hypothetical protein